MKARTRQQQGDRLPDLDDAVDFRAARRIHRTETKYAVQRRLRELDELPKSVRTCGFRAKGCQATVARRWDGRGSWIGLSHCKNKLACPVCADYALGEARTRLQQWTRALLDRGGRTGLLTYTLRHGVGDDPRVLRSLLTKAHSRFVSGNSWKAIAKRVGYLGTVRAVETTWGPRHGYHPHIHAMVFFERPLSDEQRAYLRLVLPARWLECVAWASGKLGLDETIGLPSLDNGLRFDYGADAAEYITKMGLVDADARGAALARELTDVGTKEALDDHRTMYEIMCSIATLRANRLWMSALADERVYLRYVEAFRGFKPILFARGLDGKINALALVVPAELATNAGDVDEPPPDPEPVYELLPHEWTAVQRTGPTALVIPMRIVEHGGTAAHLREFFRECEAGTVTVPSGPLYGPGPAWDRRPTDEIADIAGPRPPRSWRDLFRPGTDENQQGTDGGTDGDDGEDPRERQIVLELSPADPSGGARVLD